MGDPSLPVPITSTAWDAFLSRHPQAHLLQGSAWGELKRSFGWEVERVAAGGAGAQVLFRPLPLGYSLAYVPKGPVGDWLPGLLPQLKVLCLRRRAFALKLEPDAEQEPELERRLRTAGLIPSRQTIQPLRTLVVDLRGSEDEILARMHPKTRYNIGLAARRGVTVRPWDDAAAFGQMVQSTAARDRFGAHVPAYYQKAYDLFHPEGGCVLLVAEAEGRALAALMAFARGPRAWYLYGASTDQDRNRMPTYLLQWEAMRWARSLGCLEYDLWGVPDAEQDELESGFASRSDGLWGVYRFKRGFGGRLVRAVGAWDLPLQRGLYQVYRLLLARGEAT